MCHLEAVRSGEPGYIVPLVRRVGRAQLTRQGPFDTYCSYQTNELNLVSLDVSDAATTKSESSWHSPERSGARTHTR